VQYHLNEPVVAPNKVVPEQSLAVELLYACEFALTGLKKVIVGAFRISTVNLVSLERTNTAPVVQALNAISPVLVPTAFAGAVDAANDFQ
jgi:hypothetical protein